MQASAAVLSFAPIRSLHQQRTQRIRDLIQPATACTADAPTAERAAMEYCLAHHLLEGAESAARRGDVTTFNWYTHQFDVNAPALSVATEVGRRIVVSPDLSSLPRSALSETPYYLIGPASQPAPAELRELTASACQAGDAAGFGWLLSAHAVVVCFLRRKRLGDTLDSWTISRLPGTVFCDHVGNPVILARDLIHEAGHNWLNDALAGTSCTINGEARFYSPWKGTKRPAFGFLHACWAFPLTMIYAARVMHQTDSEVRRFLTAYLDQQRGHLSQTRDDHARAVALVTDASLRHTLDAVYREALSL